MKSANLLLRLVLRENAITYLSIFASLLKDTLPKKFAREESSRG